MATPAVSRASESFGHYLLPLTMNKGHLNPKQAEYHIEVKTKYLDLKKNRPERHALRNLLGMLHFRLNKFDESLSFFDKILSDGEDPENLNALANKKYICNELYRIPESRKCEEKISELLPNDYQDEGEKSRLRRARSLAEQAFTYSFDVFDESVTTERHRTSVGLYDEAFELAGDSLTKDEREDWMISKGMACHKIFNQVKFNKTLQNEAKKLLGVMVNIFIHIVKETDDNSLASESWRQLGEIFQQAKKTFFIQVPRDYRKYINNPINCFKRALHCTPNDPRILARFAKFFRKINNKEEALKKVNQSIELDATAFNYFAFAVRGQFFLQDYEKQLQNRSNHPDDSLLIQALNDFEKLSEIHPTPMDLEVLAQVYYYMAIDCHRNFKAGCDGQKYLNKALTVCARAAACQDGEKRPLVHKIRGQSLCALGEHRQSLRSFQRAIECTEYKQVVFESANLLFVEYGHVLENIGDTLSSDKPFLADMVYWLHEAAKLRLSNPQWTTYSITTLTSRTSQWKSFVEFCKDNDYIRELEDILDAPLEPRQRRFQQRRTVTTPDVESLPQQPHRMRHSQSVTEEASGARFEHVNVNPHARIESATASLSGLDLDDNEESSEAKQDTSTINQDWTSADASNKHIRSAPEKALNHSFTYDFFVIYSSSASEWVLRCLLKELELRGLKGCIEDREFIVGEFKANNYTGSIVNSGCVVIVITEDFKQDCWFEQGMLMAYEAKKLLIPVLREDTELPMYLNTPNFDIIDATGPVEWEKLKRRIEQHLIRLDDA